ncbi:DNA repair protein RecN [Rothia sp. AR01]|uniref:DNA repair protein RecN n=1 Tax=Rothia santali TaxID=2949643 RepID=A0A9X2HDN6_9MICC|nr:DNA repair protein RecN [Rothia santali]MCP3425284.1 DNA repair protein RecN [Rothia santali]
MIEEINIRDLGVITNATLPLGPGLTVLTGETGAGKTMVVTALGMLLGARSDAAAVRSGAASALAQAVVRLPRGHRALPLVEEAGGEVLEVSGEELSDTHPQEVILSRTVNASGRSRATVGGAAAPIGTLARLGEQLVAVHGQTDQLRLKSAHAQRETLDAYAGERLAAVLAEYRGNYEQYRVSAQELREVRENSRARAFEAQSLTAALKEIDSVQPEEGEEEALDAESARLTNVEQLREAAQTAQAALIGGYDAEADTVSVLLDAARRSLEAEADDDPALADLSQRVRELMILATDVGEELSGYLSDLDAEGPGRLAQVETRRAALKKLTRKYGADIPEVLEWARVNRARLEQLSDDPARTEALEDRLRHLRSTMQRQAAELTELRREAGERLAEAVSHELSALAMPNATLVVTVDETEKFGPEGKDVVALMLAPHRGATARPLGKGASGGELSRVMLALEVVLAEVDPVPTFIFDEVDAGVGGKAAVEIGKRLAMLARHVQVLVVTHLPQVAAYADRHVLVLKNDDATLSRVDVLDTPARIVEMARMLAGHEDSEAAREHARELLQGAGQLGE